VQKNKGKLSFSLFRQKIKISFSKTRLNDIVNELRLYNEDLGRLSNQIQQLAGNQTQSSTTVTDTVTSHLYLTRQASIRLYDVLASGWACDDRVEHLATMSLKVEDKGRQSASKVKFNLAVTCVKPRIQTNPLWLEIESAPNEVRHWDSGSRTFPSQRDMEAARVSSHPIQAFIDSRTQQVNQDASQNEHAVVLQTTLKKMGAMRKVQFALSSTMTTKKPLSRVPPSLGPQLDLCAMGKLCGYFQQLNLQPPGEPCMGFLEKSKTFKHFVYRATGPTSQPATPSLSLKQLLSTSMKEVGGESWIEKLRLARLLSLAVLRFHSTPWLSESWSSSDVCFYKMDPTSQPTQLLESPCLKTRLSTSPTNVTHPIASASSLAANEALFSLGVVLIELGYNASFETLSEFEGVQVGTHKQVVDFIAARRLGESVHKKLNMTYGRLVEKCLNCNFGVATKLEDTELQSAVVIHVVNQLDICLEQYRAFNALAPVRYIHDG
jgi:hypothetical protein